MHKYVIDKMSDYYQLLGVSKSATQEELKKAYKKMAMKHHPDRNKGDSAAEEKFKEINAAYDVLKDEQKRAQYDRYGKEGMQGGGGASGFGGGGFGGFSDIFDDLFSQAGGGGRGGRSQQRRSAGQDGSDIRYDLNITLEQAYAGLKQEIKYTTYAQCQPCHGQGGEDLQNCSTCAGHGVVRSQQGFFAVERACPKCGGAGQTIKKPCKKCSGAGRVNKNITLSATIPAGVENGTRMRLSGKGEAGIRGGATGDLYLFISVAKHNIFERDEADIYCQVPISMGDAILGGSIDIPTISGNKTSVKIPKATQSGQRFRLKEKGMPKVNSSNRFGDMYIEVEVETPTNLTKEQEKLIKEFTELSGKKTNPHGFKWLDKVKNFFK